jgi:hypothetical protein
MKKRIKGKEKPEFLRVLTLGSLNGAGKSR